MKQQLQIKVEAKGDVETIYIYKREIQAAKVQRSSEYDNEVYANGMFTAQKNVQVSTLVTWIALRIVAV